jgi:hypothetical protein
VRRKPQIVSRETAIRREYSGWQHGGFVCQDDEHRLGDIFRQNGITGLAQGEA